MRNLIASSVLLAAAAGAQPMTPKTVGLTQTLQALLQEDTGTCLHTTCFIGMLLGGFSRNLFDGGTAFDMNRNGVWVSNGPLVAMVDPTGCSVMCPPFRPAISGTITGLAMHEASDTIYALTSTNELFTFAAGCPWRTISRCRLTFLSSTWVAGGLAIDDKTNHILIAAGDLTTGIATIFVTNIASPCVDICRYSNLPCLLGLPTGAAFDPCTDVAHVTDGRNKIQISCDFATCSFHVRGCCTSSCPDPYIGLCLMPEPSTSMGVGCTTIGCIPCAPLHTVSTVPYPGNPAFNLNLSQAPTGALGILIIGQGPCQPVGFPFSCDAIRPIPIWVTFGPVALGGGGGCTGAAMLSIGIPNNYGLCGLQVATQWYVAYPGTDDGLSNCVTWTISGS